MLCRCSSYLGKTINTPTLNGGGRGGVQILLFSEVTLFEYNVYLNYFVTNCGSFLLYRQTLPSLHESKPCTRRKEQHAKKAASDSLGLMDFAIGPVTSVHKWCFSENSNHIRTVTKLSHQKLFSVVVEITSGLLHSSYSLPKWQAANFLHSEERNRWHVIFHQKVSSFSLWWERNENIGLEWNT